MKDLAGKVAFITGGASGIGYAMAKAFAGAGMKVVIADIEKPALDAAVESFKESNAEVLGIELDVTDRDAMEAAAQQTVDHFGKVHVVCNNAGVGGGGPLDQASYNDWDWVLGVNLGGVVNGIQAFVNRIKSHGEGGHIVNTASMAGLVGIGGMGVYNASKFAVVGISEALRQDLSGQNIGVSVLCPGFVKTRIHEGGRNRPADLLNDTDDADSEDQVDVDGEVFASPVLNGIDPQYVGDRVLEAVEKDDLYILTHPEMKDLFASRIEGVLAAFDHEGHGDDSQQAIADAIEAGVGAGRDS